MIDFSEVTEPDKYKTLQAKCHSLLKIGKQIQFDYFTQIRSNPLLSKVKEEMLKPYVETHGCPV